MGKQETCASTSNGPLKSCIHAMVFTCSLGANSAIRNPSAHPGCGGLYLGPGVRTIRDLLFGKAGRVPYVWHSHLCSIFALG